MRLRSLLFPLCACALGGYFVYSLQTGDHGLEARDSLAKRKAVLEGELAGLKEVRQRLERDVSLLRPESIDPDMLDERARVLLNFSRKDDIVIFTPTR